MPPAPAPPPAASKAAPPPLDPPPAAAPTSGPSFLKRRDEVAPPPRRESRRAPDVYQGGIPALPPDFVLRATPWVDFSLTNFWMDERSSNFLNLGVQVGGYFFERMRVTLRLIAPLAEAEDERLNVYDSGTTSTASRSIAVLYAGSVGLILSNSRTFLFAPGVLLWRTDVNDYGTSALLSLPFEWTTRRQLRTGFELALGHSFGGYRGYDKNVKRPGGTAILLQYSMGWSLGQY